MSYHNMTDKELADRLAKDAGSIGEVATQYEGRASARLSKGHGDLQREIAQDLRNAANRVADLATQVLRLAE
jgi:hypothetical protein